MCAVKAYVPSLLTVSVTEPPRAVPLGVSMTDVNDFDWGMTVMLKLRLPLSVPSYALQEKLSDLELERQAGPLDQATSGSLTLTTVDSGVLAGRFDFVFVDGHVSGTFTAPAC